MKFPTKSRLKKYTVIFLMLIMIAFICALVGKWFFGFDTIESSYIYAAITTTMGSIMYLLGKQE